jgi:hypothetical protein
MRSRTVRTAAAVAAGVVVLGVTAAPAEASSYGKNSSYSHSVIYTRHCLDYSSSSCKLVTVRPGQSFPRNTAYAMPGTGWTMRDVVDGNPSISGSRYVKVDTLGLKLIVWYVS